MRKNIITILVVITCAMMFVCPIQAQNNTEMGIKGGLDLANLTDDASGVKSKLGFGIGALIRFNQSPQFSIQPEVLLIQKGAKEKEDDSDGESINFTYIEIPVLFKYQPPSESSYKPAFFAGPAFGLLLSAKIGDDDFKDQMKGTEFGLVFGAGVDIKTKKRGYISIDGRYTFGLSDILDSEYDDSSVKNGVFYIGLSYIFSPKKASL